MNQREILELVIIRHRESVEDHLLDERFHAAGIEELYDYQIIVRFDCGNATELPGALAHEDLGAAFDEQFEEITFDDDVETFDRESVEWFCRSSLIMVSVSYVPQE